jgi:glycosyltransferase involved in cell wall biosynthesis
VGDQGVLIDDNDPLSITAAMKKIAEDKHAKQKLVHKGPEQANKYSWTRSAQAIIDGLGEFL